MGIELKEAVDWTVANWPLVTAGAVIVGGGIKHAFNAKSGVYGMDRNGQCQVRLNNHDIAAEKILSDNPDIKSVLTGHAESVYFSRRSDKEADQIDNGGLILNIPSNILRLYMLLGKLDNSQRMLEIATHPINEEAVPKSVRDAAKKVGNGYTLNPLKKLVSSYFPVPDKKTELSEEMIRTAHHLAEKKGDYVSFSRGVLSLRREDDEGAHLIVLPANESLYDLLTEIHDGKNDLTRNLGINAQTVTQAITARHATLCKNHGFDIDGQAIEASPISII